MHDLLPWLILPHTPQQDAKKVRVTYWCNFCWCGNYCDEETGFDRDRYERFTSVT